VPDLPTLSASLLPQTPGPYLGLILAGFAIGILGHMSSSRRLVIAGIGLIAIGALLMPIALRIESPPNVENAR
jgi:hypothetical protein